jgi:LysR family transcriptional regulator, hydrogen peroxide-inducible genes activator
MELYQVRYFLAVADTLNFTRASERSFVSQPALTKAIQRLEDTIGGRLFDRGRRTVQLTELGRRLLPDFRRISETAHQAREAARRLTKARRDVVRVGVMCSIDFQQVLPGFVASQEGRTAVELSFREGNLEALTEALDQGDVDLGVLCSPEATPRRFAATALYREGYVLAFGDDHRFNGRRQVDVAELHRERYCERMQCEFSSHIEQLLRDRGVHIEVVQQSAREDWIQALVRANFGVAFMPVSIAEAAGLAHVTMHELPIVREVKLLRPADRPATPAQQAVIDSLLAHGWQSTRAQGR